MAQDPHRLILPTRESFLRDGRKWYRARCSCGHSAEAYTFEAAVQLLRVHTQTYPR